jgi:hypothetical protein
VQEQREEEGVEDMYVVKRRLDDAAEEIIDTVIAEPVAFLKAGHARRRDCVPMIADSSGVLLAVLK